ncbi:Gag-pol polyprotein [Melia azedarach]|uniref:Gag-pol polyprotein n=1 Tax=Melia azedarach TaxID=155640 RepID=A0ACC1X108_MELAZ|nr:Gag-pol polyprotein [Melia azedarach]
MEEFRNDAFENAQIQKEKTKKWHDNRILRREFKEEEQVLLFTSRLKLFPRKIRSRWSGPFLVNKDFLFGAVELQGNDGRCVSGRYSHLISKFRVVGSNMQLYTVAEQRPWCGRAILLCASAMLEQHSA